MLLASSSPRRRDLLREAGVAFEVAPPQVDEPAWSMPLPPVAQAEALAYFKARNVWARNPDRVVLGADTIVAAGSDRIGKPSDVEDARRMLETLSGSRHAVITGVALLLPGDRRHIASDTTYVTMRPMSPEEIQAYLDSGEWEGKAGAYAIQETADRFVTRLEGSFSNVVGLPVQRVVDMISQARRQEVRACDGD
jgi:septum formation protein